MPPRADDDLFDYLQDNPSGWRKLTSEKAALPALGTGASVDVLAHLPPDLELKYRSPDGGTLREQPPLPILLDMFPVILGVERGEYAPLLHRMDQAGMVAFQDYAPQVVNGLFGVKKDEQKDRVIFDGRRCNMFFNLPDKVSLPSPTGLADLMLPPDSSLYVCKTDMDNQFHRLRAPEWLWQYFGLPRISSVVLGLPGPRRWVHPVLKSVPMGWAHSVLLAQAVHTSLVDSSHPEAASQRIPSTPSLFCVGAATNTQYIDDYMGFGTDPVLVNQHLQRVIDITGESGLPAKASKVSRVTET